MRSCSPAAETASQPRRVRHGETGDPVGQDGLLWSVVARVVPKFTSHTTTSVPLVAAGSEPGPKTALSAHLFESAGMKVPVLAVVVPATARVSGVGAVSGGRTDRERQRHVS